MLHCFDCGAQNFLLSISNQDRYEVRDGSIQCKNCGRVITICNGIVNMLREETKEINCEIAGTKKFLTEKYGRIY